MLRHRRYSSSAKMDFPSSSSFRRSPAFIDSSILSLMSGGTLKRSVFPRALVMIRSRSDSRKNFARRASSSRLSDLNFVDVNDGSSGLARSFGKNFACKCVADELLSKALMNHSLSRSRRPSYIPHRIRFLSKTYDRPTSCVLPSTSGCGCSHDCDTSKGSPRQIPPLSATAGHDRPSSGVSQP